MLLDMRKDDLWVVIAHGLAMAQESPVYSSMHTDTDYTRAYLHAAWDAGILFGVVDQASRGCMFGSVSGNWSSPTLRAYEWMLYVEPAHRRSSLAVQLINRFEQMARERGATKLSVGSSTGINDEGVRKLYERLGYSSIGSSLQKDL